MLTSYMLRGDTVPDAQNLALDLFARIDAKLDAMSATLNTQMIRLTRLEERDQTDAVKSLGRSVETLARKVERLQDHQIQITTLEKDIAQIQALLMKEQAFEAGRAHVVKQGWELGKFIAEHGGKIAIAIMLGWTALQSALLANQLKPRAEAPLPYASAPVELRQ